MHCINGFFSCTLLLLCAIQPLQAATVFRCEDSNGHITFTLQGCPADQLQDLHQAQNLSPSSGKPVAMAHTSKRAKPSLKQAHDLVVVAERQDGCGNRLIGSQRRTAIIRQQVHAGMTQADVESSLGKPDGQTSINGDTQYIYKADNGSGRKVTFDQNGCVKSKH